MMMMMMITIVMMMMTMTMTMQTEVKVQVAIGVVILMLLKKLVMTAYGLLKRSIVIYLFMKQAHMNPLRLLTLKRSLLILMWKNQGRKSMFLKRQFPSLTQGILCLHGFHFLDNNSLNLLFQIRSKPVHPYETKLEIKQAEINSLYIELDKKLKEHNILFDKYHRLNRSSVVLASFKNQGASPRLRRACLRYDALSKEIGS